MSEKRVELSAITGGFFTALAEMAKISQHLPADERESDISLKLKVLEQMMAEIMGKHTLSVQSQMAEIDDLVPYNADDVVKLQRMVDQYVLQSQNPAWGPALRKLRIDPAKMLEDLVADAVDTTLKGDRCLRLNFLTAAALGSSPKDLISKVVPMQRTKALLIKWAGLDLPLVSATIVHSPMLERADIIKSSSQISYVDDVARGANRPELLN